MLGLCPGPSLSTQPAISPPTQHIGQTQNDSNFFLLVVLVILIYLLCIGAQQKIELQHYNS